MKALERLQAARKLTLAGNYQDALEHLIWFHEHALEESISLRGVRLSFAIADWVELSSKYPAAMTALTETRNRKAQALLSGEYDRQHFIDIVSIDKHINEQLATYQLFIQLRSLAPAFIETCNWHALPAVVYMEDFKLAREMYGDLDEQINQLVDDLNDDVARQRADGGNHEELAINAFMSNFVDALQRLLRTASQTDGGGVALALQTRALNAISDFACRKNVIEKLNT